MGCVESCSNGCREMVNAMDANPCGRWVLRGCGCIAVVILIIASLSLAGHIIMGVGGAIMLILLAFVILSCCGAITAKGCKGG